MIWGMARERDKARMRTSDLMPDLVVDLEEEFDDGEGEIPTEEREPFRFSRLPHIVELFDRIDRVVSAIGFMLMIGFAYLFCRSWLTLYEQMFLVVGLASLVFCFFIPLKDPNGVFGQIVQITMILTATALFVFIFATWLLKYAVIN